MGAKVKFTYKQEKQIIGIMENMHQSIVYPNNMDNAGVIALIRACRDYCKDVQGSGFLKRLTNQEEVNRQRLASRDELMKRLDVLSIRYYEHM